MHDHAAASGSHPNPPPTKMLPPATNLRIRVGTSQAKGEALLDAAASAWDQAASTAIILNRTPRLYQTEPVQERPIPGCQVRALRSGGNLWLRLQWDDPTKNAPEAPPARKGEGGELLYKRPTGETAAFTDAAAVMVPDTWIGPAFPSLLMGDKQSPACLYHWSASRGARVMTATGRATPQPTGQTIPHRARHENGLWVVTLALADQPDGYPVAFAIWDGEFADRDGLKFFSVWHVLTKKDDVK
ncbi:MAG: hypothetical protein JNM56_26535 [Planctomycetia bacterium]|nr:hypothetical protein [Planctomycetia bacterium]